MKKLLAFVLAFTMIIGNQPFSWAAVTDGTEDTNPNDGIVVSVGDESIVLGDEGNVSVEISNPGTEWLYNINIELVLGNGVTFVPSTNPTDPQHASVEDLDDAGSLKQLVNWVNVTDLAPGQSYTLNVPVKVLEHYKQDGVHTEDDDSTGFNSITSEARASASFSPYFFDDFYASDNFDVSVTPFKVTMTSPGKQLKGAGTTADSNDNFNTFSQTLTIENNAYFPSVVDISHVVPNGVEINDLSDSSGTVTVEDGVTTLSWQIELASGDEWTATYKAAIFDKMTDNGVVNSGNRIEDGTSLPFTVDYSGETLQFEGTTEEMITTVSNTEITKNAIAKDLILSKSSTVTDGSNLGYGSEIEYTLKIETAQYSTMTAIVVTDAMGDGLDCIEDDYNGSDYELTASAGTLVTDYEHIAFPGSEEFEWKIDTMTTGSSAMIELSAVVLPEWTKGVLNGKPIVAGDAVNNSSSVYSKAADIHDASEIGIAASNSINKPIIKKELISVNGDPISVVDGFYNVQVGDELRLRLTYDASNVNAMQKNVNLFDFYPFETEFMTSNPEHYDESVVFYENGSEIAFSAISTTNPDGASYEFDASVPIWNSAEGNQAFFGYGDDEKLFRASFPLIPKNTVLAVEYVLTVKDTLEIINGNENQSMAKASLENSFKNISSAREQIGFLYQAPELSFSKSILTAKEGLVSGNTVEFKIEVVNDGNAPAYNVVLTDILDSELYNISGTSTEVNYAILGNELKITIPVIDAESTATVLYQADIIEGIGALRAFENNASLDTYQKILDGPNYTDQTDIDGTSMEAAGPTITKTIVDTEHSPVRVGDWVVYKIDIAAPTGITLYNSKLTENIPSGQSIDGAYESYDAATDVAGAAVAYTPSGTNAIFDLGDYSDASKTIYVKTIINSAVGVSAVQTNSAVVSWEDKNTGGESHNVLASTDVTVNTPKLEASWDIDDFTLVTGETQSLVYTIENTGENIAYGFVPTIKIPVGLTPSNWTVVPTSGPVLDASGKYNVYTFPEIASLAVDESQDIGFDISVDANRAAGEQLDIIGNTGEYYTTPAKTVSIDSVSATSKLTIPSVVIAKIITGTSNGTSINAIRPGDTVTYNILVTVKDGTSAYNLEIRDRLPAGFELVSFTKGGSDYVAESFNPLGNIMADGADETMSFTVIARATIDGAYGGVLDYRARNLSDIRWDLSETMDENKSAGSNRDIRVKQPEMEITEFKTTDNINTFNTEGQDINFTATIKNTGSSAAYDTVVTAEIPSGMTVSNVGPAGTFTGDVTNGHIITWNFDEIAVGAEPALSYTLTEDGNLTGTPSNGDVVLEIEKYFSTGNAGAKQYESVDESILLNQPPYANDFTIVTDEDTAQSGIGIPIDIDTAESLLTYELVTPPLSSEGTFDINSATKTWTFTPYQDFNGSLTVEVLIDDNHGGTDTVVIDIIVNPVNDPPIISDYSKLIAEDTVLNSSVAGTDIETLTDDLTYSLGETPLHGTVLVNEDGTYTYTPNLDFNGTDTFTVIVSDGNGGTAISTVTVNVSPDADPPILNNDSFTTEEDTPHNGTIEAEDVDTLTGDLIYSLGDTPLHGTVLVNEDGTYTYTPDEDYNGPDNFSIVVTDGTHFVEANVAVTVTPVNDDPETRDYVYTIDEEGIISNTILANDIDDGDTLTFSIQTPPDVSEGIFTINEETGEWDFTAAKDFNGGPVIIEVLISDGNGGSVVSTISITVNPINDPPKIPDYAKIIDEDTVLNSSVLGTDVDDDDLTYSKKTDPINGTVTVYPYGGYVYTPDEHFHGTDIFTIEVSDGNGGIAISTIVVNINSEEDPPQVPNYSETTEEDTPVDGTVVGTDPDGDDLEYIKGTDPIHGSVEVSIKGAWTYTPDENYHGEDSFTIIVSDGSDGFAVSTVDITIGSENDPPEVPDYEYRIRYNTEHEGSIVGIDLETLAEDLTYTVNTPPTNGTLLLNSDGTYVYTPDSGYRGDDFFTINVSDENGGTAVSTVTYEMYKPSSSSNNSPEVPDYSFSTSEGVPVSGTVEGTDSDGNTLSYSERQEPSNGTLTVDNDGSWTYEPFDGYTGTDEFTVKVSDGRGGSAISTITIEIGDIEYAIDLKAIPSSILGDGNTETQLIALVTDILGQPVSGVEVVFSAPTGEFPEGTVAVTDSLGEARVPYGNVDLSGSIDPITIEVTATVDDYERDLHAVDTVQIHFMPAVLRGAAYDANLCGAVENAEVLVSADFDDDGIVDFEGIDWTDEDGIYEVGVPYGNEVYDVYISFDFELYPGRTERRTFYQKGTADKTISGVGDIFHSERIHYTLLTVSDENGNTESLNDFNGITFKLYRYISGSPIQMLGSIGVGQAVDLAFAGEGVLYAAADEELEEVDYPITFAESDGMVYIEMPDFADERDYKLSILNSSGEEIGQEDFRMMADGQFCVGSVLIASSDIDYDFTQKDLAVVLTSDKRKVAENGTIELTIDYYNRTGIEVDTANLELTIPKGFIVIDAAGGRISDGKITWELEELEANIEEQVTVVLSADTIDVPEKTVEFIARISSEESLVNLQDDVSKLTVLVYSTSLEHMHTRYIKGYPDYTFRPENSITRAEVAAIFARILGLEDTVTGQKHYSDVENAHWAEEYIEAVTKQGLFKGDPDGTFRPESAITRAELAVVVSRYFDTERNDSLQPISSFFVDTDGHWAENTIEEIHRIGVVSGYPDGTYKPQNAISRPEAITMVNRMLFRGPLENTEATFPDMPLSHWASGHAEESIRTHKFIYNTDGSETMTEFIPEPLW